jgi:hypothetical protein
MLLFDMRKLNGRPGESTFDVFWQALQEYFMSQQQHKSAVIGLTLTYHLLYLLVNSVTQLPSICQLVQHCRQWNGFVSNFGQSIQCPKGPYNTLANFKCGLLYSSVSSGQSMKIANTLAGNSV